LAARQFLLERARLMPADAIRRLTPLQGQHPRAPFLALAARLDGFTRRQLEQAIDSKKVVKTTLMRHTLHHCAADDYPAYAQLSRAAHLRTWRKRYGHLDEERIVAQLARWLSEPRTNVEIRERVARYDGVPETSWEPVFFARTLLPLVQLPPGGFWDDRSRVQFVVDPRPAPSHADAATLVLGRYLAAFGPASLRDVARWAGATQRDFGEALDRVKTVSYRDEQGAELLDLPDQPLPPASTRLPVRLLPHWDQALLAHADRERIIPAELVPLKLTLSGDCTVTVDGRVAASWKLVRDGNRVRIVVMQHTEIPKRARSEIRVEADRVARFAEPDASSYDVVGG
jgi:hypothetical protein